MEIPVNSTTAPFGEISLLAPTPRAGKMTAAEDAVLLCLCPRPPGAFKRLSVT